jgi:hypothetical protein
MRTLVLVALAGCSFRQGVVSGLGSGSDASGSDSGPAGWWDPSYAWRVPLTISTTAALATGFQVGFPYDLDATPCETSPTMRDAVRIVFGTTEQARVIDELGAGDEWLWFPLVAPLAAGSSSTGDYWLYCGDSSPPPAPSNPASVFEFYDGFGSGAIDTSVWTVVGSASISNDQLMCGSATGSPAGGENGVVTTTLAFPPSSAVDFIATATGAAADFWAGFQNGSTDTFPYLEWYASGVNTIGPDYRVVGDPTGWFGATTALDTAPHLYGVEYYGASAMYRMADVESATYTDTNAGNMPPATINLRLWNHLAAPAILFQMVRVRQAVNPPPTVTVGAAQRY